MFEERLLRRLKYLHRGSQRNFYTTEASIKDLCSRSTHSDTHNNIHHGVFPINVCYPKVTAKHSERMRLESVRLAYLNVCSLNKKTALLYDIIPDKKNLMYSVFVKRGISIMIF